MKDSQVKRRISERWRPASRCRISDREHKHTMRLLFIAFLIFAADLKSEFESLVQAERAFSDLSLKSGVRDAFLGNLADDGIVFRPTAVNGKQWFQNNPVPAGQLTWQPEFADISNSADLG